MSLLLRGGWIVTQNPRRELVRGDVLVEGGTIANIGQVRDSADRVIDCTDCAVLPGLINTHHHVANTLLRGVADDVPLEGMLEKAYAIDAKLTRRDVQMGALLGCIEMLKSGTTSFHDLFYWEDEVARGVREAGIRGFLSWVVLDEAFTTQRGSPLKNAEQFVKKHKGDDLVTPSVGLQGVYVCSEESYAGAKALAEREGVGLHTHLSETRGEVYNHRKKTGLRPVEWLDKIGFLCDRLVAAHAVWVTLNEVRALARHGVRVAHCPTSNMKLASGGVAPLPEMFEAGVTVSLGTDSPISNNGMDMFQEMKVCALLQKSSRWDASVAPAQRVLDLATIDAARALRVEDRLGSIETGKAADLAVLDLHRAHATPFNRENIIRHLVYACRGGDVRYGIVGGKVVVDEGSVTTVDEGAVVDRVQEIAAELYGVNA
ncbi:MAG: metal-dependent hydrolase [Methanobacteriota archaeon]|nr:MAG: metal-dependent hydrolase [Euryarchaeota archaeon]